jgi:hypothetical protein
MSMVTALLSELVIVRERLDTVERLAEGAGVLNRSEIDAFQPTAEAVAERDRIRRRAIAKVLRPLRDEAARSVTEV